MAVADEEPADTVNGPRVLVYVQHLVGIGHFRRAAVISRTAAARGMDVTLMSGGRAPSGIDLGVARLVQLPAVHATEDDYSTLIAEDGSRVGDTLRRRRAGLVLEAFERFRPDLLVVELFPFGRRQMKFELLPLLRAARDARPRPVVVSSVRDILVGQSRTGRADEARGHLDSYFDYVLVHADPSLVTLGATFPQAHRIEEKVRYTGYVVDRISGGDGADGTNEVVVSAGGGAVGQYLLEVALACRLLTASRDRIWRLLVGSRGAAGSLAARPGGTDSGVVVEAARPDFPALLSRAAVSVSQGGYNTVVETLQARTPAVIVPFATGVETEQTVRAELLRERGLIEVVSEAELSPENLAHAVDSAYRAGPKDPGIDLSGADTTADILEAWARRAARHM